MTLPRLSGYLPSALHLLKMAEDKTTIDTDEPKTHESPSSIALKNLLAYGVGIGIGGGLGYGADKLYHKVTGKDAPFLVPAVATAAGLAGNYMYNKWKATELERMQDAFQRKRDGAARRPSGQ